MSLAVIVKAEALPKYLKTTIKNRPESARPKAKYAPFLPNAIRQLFSKTSSTSSGSTPCLAIWL